MPAIRTRQMDGGVRIALPRAMKLIVGAFDLRKPFLGFDQAGIYGERGDIRNQGVEFSLSGQPTPRLNVVAGGFLLRPRVREDGGLPPGTGKIPVGLADRLIQLSANWQTPWEGLSLDGGAVDIGRQAGTQANDVFIASATQFNFGTRYSFKLASNQATFRLSMNNLTGVRRWQPLGPGAYVPGGGRFLSGYLTVDL
jgi:iron complex outermembrane receptor protein